ncbi:MAG: hypothetical protein GF401_08790 [Chitinivibrionales bacterium]|nr:hypothetical protein [Chitinivibrionales bacterium]
MKATQMVKRIALSALVLGMVIFQNGCSLMASRMCMQEDAVANGVQQDQVDGMADGMADGVADAEDAAENAQEASENAQEAANRAEEAAREAQQAAEKAENILQETIQK